MVIKLDMANAFNRVKHNFLFVVLARFGFGVDLLAWISSCISSPWIAPMINGRPIDFFKISRGLRQGCRLSPLLYILMAKALSRSLEQVRKEKAIPGIKITKGVKKVNHSQFADNTLLLGGASSIIARKFTTIPDEFMMVLGGKINRQKTQIYVWNTK